MSSADIVKRRLRRLWLWPLLMVLLLAAAVFAAYELIASPLQAMVLAGYGKRLTFQLQEGRNATPPPSPTGPYDVRLGYPELPRFITRLEEQGFEVTHQARVSADMARIADFGLFMPYAEKSVAGLELLDCSRAPLKTLRFPARTYTDFTAVPPVVANTLLFIENRELLDPNHPQRNPAVEWDRLGAAVLEKILQTIDPSRNVPGGSTLATQIEKYRHSPDGLTLTAGDKLRQMASASLRAYLDGEDTLATRRRIVLDYLNTVPLAAAPGFGEVNGVGDGLAAWFGLDFDKINGLLRNPAPTAEAARAYKHVLALLISQRKPSYYLINGRSQLEVQANTHLRLLASMGIITPQFRDVALDQRIVFNTGKAHKETASFADRKATSTLRVELMNRLGVPRLYEVDRLDLTARATLHGPTQYAVSDFLQRLSDPIVVDAADLYGPYLLAPENDLTKPIYSFTLYENTVDGALLRVQADNLNQPFDINKGAKLDMGSSAKLRTLITYLQVVAELHQQYSALPRAQLLKARAADKDLLLQWVLNYLVHAEDKSLHTMLRAAMSRQYSASPEESFFTGGGVHRFANFKRDDDGKVMDLWEATRNSVNLPFIRLMRDIVRHFMYRDPKGAAQILSDPSDPRRDQYLKRFADQEGRAFLVRFHKKYKGLGAQEASAALLNHLTANPKRLAAVYRYLEPQADIAAFTTRLKSRLGNPGAFDEGDFKYLYETYGPDKFSLSDRGYIAQVHPLELWLVAYLRAHPGATWDNIVEASRDERIQVYDWLINTSRKNAQDIRIHSLLEIEAFQEVHKRWRMLGYPFGSLVPSYATAIGSSADRPAALAELMGVIANDGVKLPAITTLGLEFAAGTPYHTIMKRKAPKGERIFPASIAQVIKEALANVVQEGTARRLKGSFPLGNGEFLALGGKTGTGDHRFEVYAANGTVLESKVMNRTATFAFYMGERFFGVMTVFVPGEAAADYHFTSGLAVQIVKILEPALRPLLLGNGAPEPGWEELVREFEGEAGTPAPSPPPAAASKALPPKPRPGPAPAPATAPPAGVTPAEEPPPAPPPPQVDKPDPPPPPQAPHPEPKKDKPPGPWSPAAGSGFQFF
ncbi:MAG: transglycosylase domain-containing protein [Pseudomonadota bacterium]